LAPADEVKKTSEILKNKESTSGSKKNESIPEDLTAKDKFGATWLLRK
jgi:hypothetical protein